MAKKSGLPGVDPAYLRLAHRVLWPGFTGLEVPGWLERALERGLAGVVLFANNIDDDPARLRALTDMIHGLGPRSLIGVDEEGGLVSRLEAEKGSTEPGNAVLGRLDEPSITESSAFRIGRRVANAGIDVNLAPVADVNSNPRNPVIGVRSFSSDTVVVARHVAAAVLGTQRAGVAACAKHFPGHGDTITDSHLDTAIADIDLPTLRRVHLPPFEAAIQAGVKAVMTAHISVPALGPSPGTVNSKTIGLLREMGFRGVVITDALDMAAISGTLGTGRGAVESLKAGADLLCTGNPSQSHSAEGPRRDETDFRRPLHAIVAALTKRELPMSRIEEAAARVDELASWCRARSPEPTWTSGSTSDGLESARRALQARGDVRLRRREVAVIDLRRTRTRAVDGATDFFSAALRERHGGRVHLCLVPPQSEADIVLLVDQLSPSPDEERLLRECPGAIVVYTGWPDESRTLPPRAVVTYGSGRAVARAVAETLCML